MQTVGVCKAGFRVSQVHLRLTLSLLISLFVSASSFFHSNKSALKISLGFYRADIKFMQEISRKNGNHYLTLS